MKKVGSPKPIALTGVSGAYSLLSLTVNCSDKRQCTYDPSFRTPNFQTLKGCPTKLQNKNDGWQTIGSQEIPIM